MSGQMSGSKFQVSTFKLASSDNAGASSSLASQRSVGRGDFELKTSSPRPSPPASLGGEGVIKRSGTMKCYRDLSRLPSCARSERELISLPVENCFSTND